MNDEFEKDLDEIFERTERSIDLRDIDTIDELHSAIMLIAKRGTWDSEKSERMFGYMTGRRDEHYFEDEIVTQRSTWKKYRIKGKEVYSRRNKKGQFVKYSKAYAKKIFRGKK